MNWVMTAVINEKRIWIVGRNEFVWHENFYLYVWASKQAESVRGVELEETKKKEESCKDCRSNSIQTNKQIKRTLIKFN